MIERIEYNPPDGNNNNICQRRYQTESGIYVPISENEPVILMPFKEWNKKRDFLEPGACITDVPPRELFTTQDWLREDKMIRAVEAQEEWVDDAFLVPGVIFAHPKEKMGIIPVLLEGNHRTVNAANNGYKINLEIVDYEMDDKKQVWRITNLLKKYPGLVRK